jgi:nucleoside-diphosphate-sugar epimerase
MVYGRGGRGNLERMARGIAAGWFPPLPETGNHRSLVHVDDVVEAVRLVATQPTANGRTYIVAGERAYSGREIYDTIRGVLGKPPARYRVPEWLLRSGGHLGDVSAVVFRRPFPFNSETADRLLGSACYLPDRIGTELGWRAGTSLTEGVVEMLGASCGLCG